MSASSYILLSIKEQLLELGVRVIWVSNRMSDSSWILVDLVVVTALVCLVAEEVDGIILDAVWLFGLVLQVLEAVCLVPSSWEYIE